MPICSHVIRISLFVALGLVASTTLADDPPAPKPAPPAVDNLKPLPPVAIPDDPPPHEGALFEFPLTIDAPDIIIVEVLEALPGRPITGERIVRPDGKISLGFYGDVYVRGLTTEQIKVKVIHQLRKQIPDAALGLMRPEGRTLPPLGKPGTRVPKSELERPFDPENVLGAMPEEMIIELDQPPAVAEPPKQENAPPEPGKVPAPTGLSKPSASLPKLGRTVRRISHLAQDPKPAAVEKPAEPAKNGERSPFRFEPDPPGPVERQNVELKYVYIDPADTPRVFVNIASYNHLVYFVQGDVGVPGRFPYTGAETVLDALNYAGGFLPTAEPTDIHLYRPARGGKPARDFLIDYTAIHQGDKKANLQMFPGDRLIVGRNPIVKKVVQIDRANALINSNLNTMLQYAFTARSLTAINNPSGIAPQGAAGGITITPAQRDAMAKEWVDFLWSISSKEGGAMLDEKAFREALLKKLGTSPEPKK